MKACDGSLDRSAVGLRLDRADCACSVHRVADLRQCVVVRGPHSPTLCVVRQVVAGIVVDLSRHGDLQLEHLRSSRECFGRAHALDDDHRQLLVIGLTALDDGVGFER